MKKGSCLPLLIFINWSVYPSSSIWISLQSDVLLVRFVCCRMKEEEDSPDMIHTLGCWDSGTFPSGSMLDSTSTTSKLFPVKTCFQDISRIASLPIQAFRLLESGYQLGHEHFQHIETGRQMMPDSLPLTNPIFLFPFGSPEGHPLPQFSWKQAKEDCFSSPLGWGGRVWLFYEL